VLQQPCPLQVLIEPLAMELWQVAQATGARRAPWQQSGGEHDHADDKERRMKKLARDNRQRARSEFVCDVCAKKNFCDRTECRTCGTVPTGREKVIPGKDLQQQPPAAPWTAPASSWAPPGPPPLQPAPWPHLQPPKTQPQQQQPQQPATKQTRTPTKLEDANFALEAATRAGFPPEIVDALRREKENAEKALKDSRPTGARLDSATATHRKAEQKLAKAQEALAKSKELFATAVQEHREAAEALQRVQ